MKYIFLFLFLLPSVSALAVTPTSVDFGEVERGVFIEREILIVNTIGSSVVFNIKGFYEESFTLQENEKRIIKVPLERIDVDDGMYVERLVVEENYGAHITNSVTLPIVFRIKGGEFTNKDLNLEAVEQKKVDKFPWGKIGGIIIFLIIGLVWFFRKGKV